MAAPIAVSPAVAASLPAGVATDVAYDGPAVPSAHDVLGNYVPGADDDTLVVVVPGTDDDRSPRIDGLIAGRDSLIVNYPESFWPIISGKSGKLMPFLAPTYDQSRGIATENTLAIMAALEGADRVVVYTGFSQGADALGNAAEQASKAGTLDPNSTIVLVSDPRGPWGVKSKLSRTPFATPLLALIGLSNDGARNPADTGDTKVVHVIVQGDPVSHLQWDPLRPLSSVLVNAAGFVAIHSGTGENTYARLDNLEHVRTLQSEDGNSTYEIYDTYHPLALLNAMIFEAMGLPVSDDQLQQWDRAAEAFYPTQEITADNADPKVRVAEVELSSGAASANDDPANDDTVTGAEDAASDAAYQAGKRRLVDQTTGDWAEATPLIGGTESDGPRHAAPEVEEPAIAPAAPVPDPTPPVVEAPVVDDAAVDDVEDADQAPAVSDAGDDAVVDAAA